MVTLFFVFPLLLFVATSNSNELTDVQAVQRSLFGQHCNETIKCDKGAWLSCKSSVCACVIEDMIFDQSKGKCVSKLGERCKFQVSAEPGSENLGLAFYENTDCVTNAHCANGFTCSCVPGYFETMNGLCLEQKLVNGPCLSTSECQLSKLLFCLDGKCQCSETTDHIWANPNNNRSLAGCVGKAGKRLSGSTSCVEGTRLQNGVCVCLNDDQFYTGVDGRCHEKKPLNSACSKDEECQFVGKFLTCLNRQCACDPATTLLQTFFKDRITLVKEEVEVLRRTYHAPNYNDFSIDSYYSKNPEFPDVVTGEWIRDSEQDHRFGYILASRNVTLTHQLSQCVGLARQTCNPEFNCIQNATCGPDRICACDVNFSPTSTGSCGIGHGQPCSKSTPCSDTFQCTNGICNCPRINHQIYNAQTQKCVGKVSSFCLEDADCSTNLVCTFALDSRRKQCTCAEDFVENTIGLCEKAWNSTCDYNDLVPCDSFAALQCRNGLCACADTSTAFDVTRRKCLGLVGTRCASSDVNSCIAGSNCVQINSLLAGRCLCDAHLGFELNNDLLCHQVYLAAVPNVTQVELTGNSAVEDLPAKADTILEESGMI